MTPREIITKVIRDADYRYLGYTDAHFEPMYVGVADEVLDALAAAGLVVIDPAGDVTEIAKQLLDFAYAIEEASVGDHGYMAVLEVRRALRAAGKATQ